MFEEEFCFILRNGTCVSHEVGLMGASGHKLTSPLLHGHMHISIYGIFMAAKKIHRYR